MVKFPIRRGCLCSQRAREQGLAQHSPHSSAVQELPLGAQLQRDTERLNPYKECFLNCWENPDHLVASPLTQIICVASPLPSVHALFQALDVWAMGITLYCFVYGKVSFQCWSPALSACLLTHSFPNKGKY